MSKRQPQPTAATLIEAAEALLTEGRAHATCLRYRRARTALETYLEAKGEDMLLDAGIAMLAIERGLEPDGALLRVATGEDLLYALPGFIDLERPGLPKADAGAQLRFVDQCRRLIVARGLSAHGDYSCASWEVDGALRRAGREQRLR
ncbi:hypothetical protein [Agromyces neolithicus]|uniref:Uncharacterized protein n=1 Tax=Agromyces neolithicus TaxID=269420 RepID=A0ABP4YLA9_9MICO